MANWLWIGSSTLLSLQWIVVHFTLGHPPPHWMALSSGVAIFGAAFMLSWAAELAQKDIPQALAIALLALIAVLPEYAVDMYFAWQAGKDPRYTSFAMANMTGANRLLIGVGWAAVVFTYWLKSGSKTIELEPGHRNEILYLGLATVYSFVIPIKGRLDIIDAVAFIAIFIFYMRAASKAEHVEPELEGPPGMIESWGESARRLFTVLFFVYSGFTIFIAAEPFAEGLLATGRTFGIEEFILVQWLAPLASESPEFIVAILFALKAQPGTSMGALLSSKVNQWTLLIGMLPVVFMVSGGRLGPMEMDQRQVEEMFLTAAQSLFAVAILANLSFSLFEATVIFVLFATQLMFPDPIFRFYYSFLYVFLAVALILLKKDVRQGVTGLFVRGPALEPSNKP
ncbi:MAG TPA: sodium:calcium antiporter [Candidatus Binatia bacterium]|nr:sodium:calcium antiporter [Candidatus Binatia bacterium]